MTLFAECDACKLARSFDQKTPLCSGCRHNSVVINLCAARVEGLEGTVSALAALLKVGAAFPDKRAARLRADLVQLQRHTQNTGLTDRVQAIIDRFEVNK
jgi:hypothetical protein